jgi:DNA polymerase-4
MVLPDLSPRIRTRLDDYQLDRIGEVAAITENALCAVFGSSGRTLRARARGIDPRPVLPPERQAEFHVAHTMATDTNDIGILHPLLRILSERLGRRLRQSRLVARRLRVEASYADHTSVARAVSLPGAALDAELWSAARRAFTLANAKRLAVHAVALTLDRLEEAEAQLELWESGQADTTHGRSGQDGRGAEPSRDLCVPDREHALQRAMDRIHTRYGRRAVAWAHAAASSGARRSP